MFTTLLQTNTECSCEHHSNPQRKAMPRHGKTRKQDKEASPGATVQDAAGGHSGRSSPSAAGASSSFPSPSQPSEYESSPEKAPRQKSRRLVTAGGSREASQPIHAGPLGSFALLSRARGPTNKIPLIDGASDAAKVNTMAPNSSAAPARKAPSGASHAQKCRHLWPPTPKICLATISRHRTSKARRLRQTCVSR